MIRRLSDNPPRVLIAGAARGVGLACAEALFERGAELILSDDDGTGLTRAAERLHSFSRFCDPISDSSVTVFAADIGELFGSIDVLINAADDGYVRTLSMVRMTRALLPLLRRARGRRLVVNIAPTSTPASSRLFRYASSPGAFDHLSSALAEQVRGTSIEVMPIRMSEDLAVAGAVADLVSARRPRWRHRTPPMIRRA